MCVSSCLGAICWKDSHVTLVTSQLPVNVRIYLGAFNAIPLISGSFFHYSHLCVCVCVFIRVCYVRMHECFCMYRVCLKVCVHMWGTDVDIRHLSWLHFVLIIEAGSVSQNGCGYSHELACFEDLLVSAFWGWSYKWITMLTWHFSAVLGAWPSVSTFVQKAL